jgi:hypothetical protein
MYLVCGSIVICLILLPDCSTVTTVVMLNSQYTKCRTANINRSTVYQRLFMSVEHITCTWKYYIGHGTATWYCVVPVTCTWKRCL